MKKILLLLLLLPTIAVSSEIKRIAVIDTGIDFSHPYLKNYKCPSGHKDFTNTGLNDLVGHGTHVAGLIRKYAGDTSFCIVSLKFYDNKYKGHNIGKIADAIEEAIKQDIKIVNISGGGEEFSEKEYLLIRDNPGTTFIVAAGNDSKDLSEYVYYPAGYSLPNIIVVGCKSNNDLRCKSSNYGYMVTSWEYGESIKSTLPNNKWGRLSGTSMSTAIRTGKFIHGNNH